MFDAGSGGNFRVLQASQPTDNYVTILAIYDDAPTAHNPTSIQQGASVSNGRERRATAGQQRRRSANVCDDFVEVLTFEAENDGTGNSLHVSKEDCSPLRQSTSTPAVGSGLRDASSTGGGFLTRSSARKSRFTDAFLDAKERLEDELLEGQRLFGTSPVEAADDQSCSSVRTQKKRIVLSPNTVNTPMGIEISGIPDPFDARSISCVEVVKVEEGGRVAEDGRIRVGDQLHEINGHKCNEMSLARAKLLLRDMEAIPQPSLCFNRPISSAGVGMMGSERATRPPPQLSNAQIRPLKSALQEANTSKVGETQEIFLRKGRDGFGFSIAGRTNAEGVHLHYVKTVRGGGAACGLLRMGDRILKITERGLDSMQQSEVTAMLKSVPTGSTVSMVVSRVLHTTAHGDGERVPSPLPAATATTNRREGRTMRSWLESELSYMQSDRELVTLDIALNESPSAGLGISLNAQRVYDDEGTAMDDGLYVKNLLHGSAAFKDGRLQMDDRLIGIEDINLLAYKLNAEALNAFTRCLTSMPAYAKFARIFIARKPAGHTPQKITCANLAAGGIGAELNGRRDTGDENMSDVSSMAPEPESFNRDQPIRKSISEKRPFGAGNDASHLQTYQKIKHQRQTSTPALKYSDRYASPSAVKLRDKRRRKSFEDARKKHLSIPATATLGSKEEMSSTEGPNGAEPSRRSRRPFTLYQPTQPLPKSASYVGADHQNAAVKKDSSRSFLSYLFGSGKSTVKKEQSQLVDGEIENSPRRRSSSTETSIHKRGSTHEQSGANVLSPSTTEIERSPQVPRGRSSRTTTDENQRREHATMITRDARRKSAGAGLLKFLHRSGPGDQYPGGFRVGDEEGPAPPRHRAPHSTMPAAQSTFTVQYGPPRIAHTPSRAPPPSYLDSRNSPYAIHHQRGYSAQDSKGDRYLPSSPAAPHVTNRPQGCADAIRSARDGGHFMVEYADASYRTVEGTKRSTRQHARPPGFHDTNTKDIQQRGEDPGAYSHQRPNTRSSHRHRQSHPQYPRTESQEPAITWESHHPLPTIGTSQAWLTAPPMGWPTEAERRDRSRMEWEQWRAEPPRAATVMRSMPGSPIVHYRPPAAAPTPIRGSTAMGPISIQQQHQCPSATHHYQRGYMTKRMGEAAGAEHWQSREASTRFQNRADGATISAAPSYGSPRLGHHFESHTSSTLPHHMDYSSPSMLRHYDIDDEHLGLRPKNGDDSHGRRSKMRKSIASAVFYRVSHE